MNVPHHAPFSHPEPTFAQAVGVYVPAPGSSAERVIARGSGVVGSPSETGLVTIDYEDDRYQIVKRRWADLVHRAYSRRVQQHPTTDHLSVPSGQVIRIGSYLPEDGCIILDLDTHERHTLTRWLGTAPDAAMLLGSAAHHVERRTARKMLASADPEPRFQTDCFARDRRPDPSDLLA